MPPKRRGAQAKLATPPNKPDPPKPAPSAKPAPAPAPAPAPPPPPPLPPLPLESDATKVRKEWAKFVDAWYEPQKKKLVEKLQKELLVKYKNLGSAKDTQKLREMELFERLDSIAQQLAQPARAEWERRLDLAKLREDQWDDMSGEEQHAVMSVFVGFFADDVEDMDDVDFSAPPSSIEEECVVDDPQYRPSPSYPPSAPPKLPIPPTPVRANFEFVNPTSFFADTMTPPNPTRHLPALSMDHLATLGPSNPARSAEPVSGGVNGTLGFQNWASEVGTVTQLPQGQPAKPSPPPPPAASAQSLSARPRATDNMSRQASAASNLFSSPLPKTSSPQHSPPNPPTKFSPPSSAEGLPPGKRYIGPVITEEDPDPMDDELLKSKMADDYQQFKISLRIQMIYQFHAEAADIEIKLVESLLTDQGTKESRARAVQEHETSMMRLRDQKEEERKRLCSEERERRREEIRQHLAQRRSATQTPREVDPAPKPNPPVPLSIPQRPGKMSHQKESVPPPPPVVAPSVKLEAPDAIKKTNSTLSQDEASANEMIFANAMAKMPYGKAGVAGLTPAQASLNESLFANAAAMLAAEGQPESSAKNALLPPSIMKKSNSSRSQEYDIPHIKVSFAENPVVVPDGPAQAPPPTAMQSRKGKKGQPAAVQPPLARSVAISEGPEMAEEPPPFQPASSLWDTAAVVAKNAWGAASASISASKTKFSASVEDGDDDDDDDDDVENEHTGFISSPALAPSKVNGSANTKKVTSASKRGKKVTITEEPDVDADPVVSPPPQPPPPASKAKVTKGGWGAVNGKSKATAPIVEESELEPVFAAAPPATKGGWGAVNGKSKVAAVFVADESELDPAFALPPARTSAWGKKPVPANAAATTTKSSSSMKPQLKVTIAEEQESEFESVSAPARVANKGKSAREVPAATPNASRQAGKKAAQQQAEPRRGGAAPSFKSVRVDPVPEPEDKHLGVDPDDDDRDRAMSAGLDKPEEDGSASNWFNPENISYWANVMAGTPEAETETLVVPETAEQADKHVRWTPTVSGESDDEGEVDEDLATNMWMEYAISGGNIPSFGDAPEVPRATPSESVVPQHDASSVWEKGKKKNPSTGEFGGNRVQQTSVFDRAAFAGQWPKMDSWLSPPSRGQSSGSARVF